MSLRRALLIGLAAAAATFTGLGLARFAWTPLVPALITAHWFDAQQTAYLGSTNLLGYLIGAATAHRLSLRYRRSSILLWAFALTMLSFVGCAWPLPFALYAVLRALAGVTGALMMVLAPTAALGAVPLAWRARTASLTFTGVGVGVIFAGVVLPLLVRHGPRAAWLVLAVVTAVLMAATWRLWRALDDGESPAGEHAAGIGSSWSWPVALALAAYSLDAVGFVPHALFWVDFIARELGRGLAAGGHYWTLFGLGATVGPLLAGELAGRIGFRRSFGLVLSVKAFAAGLPFFVQQPWALAVSSVAFGAMVPGSVAMASGRAAELAAPGRYGQVWGWMTSAFAVTQAVAAYAMAWAYGELGSYRPLYGIAGAVLCVAAVCAVVPPLRRRTAAA